MSEPPTKPISEFLGKVICGDCIEVMRTMPPESVDLAVTDPPYLVNYQARDGRRYGSGGWNRAWLACEALKPEVHLNSRSVLGRNAGPSPMIRPC